METKYGFTKGDIVEVVTNVSGDYIGDTGTVVGFTTNMFGRPLVKVIIDWVGADHTSVFYPNELKIVGSILAK